MKRPTWTVASITAGAISLVVGALLVPFIASGDETPAVARPDYFGVPTQDVPSLSPKKYAHWLAEKNRFETAIVTTPSFNRTPPPDDYTPAPLLSGLHRASPRYPSAAYTTSSIAWYGWIDGTYAMVYAGAEGYPEGGGGRPGNDPTQGIVLIDRFPGELADLAGAGAYATPTLAGSLTITGEHDRVLSLVAANGDQFYFDIDARSFVPAPVAEATAVTE